MEIAQQKEKSTLDYALEYEKLGWSIIPIRPKDKTPLFQWKKFESHRATTKEILQWFQENPNINIAVITGSISGIIALDIDTKHNRSSNDFSDMGLSIPQTANAKTGSGGEHLIFKHPGGHVKSTNGQLWGEGIDIKADGGYIVLAPSIHPNGEKYTWINSPEKNIADAPQWLLDKIKENDRDETSISWQDYLVRDVVDGERNQIATKIIGGLLNILSEERWETDAWSKIQRWNTDHCKPPASERELRSTFDSIAKAEKKKKYILNDATSLRTSDLELSQSGQNPKLKIEYSKNIKAGSYQIAKYLAKSYSAKTLGERNREILIYDNGIYRPGENDLRGEIQIILEELATKNGKNEIIDKIRDLTVANRKDFEVDLNMINLQNGIFNIRSGELIKHDPKYMFLSKIPVKYNPSAICPKINSFFSQILDTKDISIINEWFGYALYRSYFIKKAMIFVGERDTGKTTMLRLLERFIGKENISGRSLQQIASDKFAAATLYNKHLNSYDDLSVRDVNDNGAFKMATGGGTISGEFKFRDPFLFANHAKLIFACNQIPNVKDTQDEAYFSRWIVLDFHKEISKPDKFLFDKVTSEEELSGLLNIVIEGLQRLLKQQEFSCSKNPEEIKAEMLKSGSSIAKFAYDCLQQKEGSWISKEEMYVKYAKYSVRAGLAADSKSKFGRRLPAFATYITEGKPLNQNTKKQETAWIGVEIKEEQIEEEIFEDGIIEEKIISNQLVAS